MAMRPDRGPGHDRGANPAQGRQALATAVPACKRTVAGSPSHQSVSLFALYTHGPLSTSLLSPVPSRISTLECASPVQGRALCTQYTKELCGAISYSQPRAPATRCCAGVPGGGRQRRDRQDVGRDVVHAALGACRGQSGALAHDLRSGTGGLGIEVGASPA